MVKLYLTRHGQTFGNIEQILQGQTQGKLTLEGVEQAKHVRDIMKDKNIDYFFSSDLERAYHTCSIIAKPHNKSIIKSKLLRERHWGAFTGEYIPELIYKEWPSDVESLEQILNRANSFLQQIREGYDEKTILVVGHGIINKALQAMILNKKMNEIYKMENAEVRFFNI